MEGNGSDRRLLYIGGASSMTGCERNCIEGFVNHCFKRKVELRYSCQVIRSRNHKDVGHEIRDFFEKTNVSSYIELIGDGYNEKSKEIAILTFRIARSKMPKFVIVRTDREKISPDPGKELINLASKRGACIFPYRANNTPSLERNIQYIMGEIFTDLKLLNFEEGVQDTDI